MQTLHIKKSSGELVPFDEYKLINSLRRSGASPDVVKQIVTLVQKDLYEGITTRKIFQLAARRLKALSRHTAGRYNLKNGIMELGPSGFPFEQFVAALLREEGYSTRVSVILHGKCVKHEIDVIAEKNNELLLLECKYHNLQGTQCDVKIPLYIKSRFDDVLEPLLKNEKMKGKRIQGQIYTNTGFTSDAITYAQCAGLNLIGWNFDEENSLRTRLDQLRLYPITVLTSLNKADKIRLIEKGIVLCKEILKNPEVLVANGVRLSKRDAVLSEIEALCHHNV